MNFFDFVKRKDRGLQIEAGKCKEEIIFINGSDHRCVRLSGNCKVKIKNANEFQVFKLKPSSISWNVQLPPRSLPFVCKGHFKLSAFDHNSSKNIILAEIPKVTRKGKMVDLVWPVLLQDYDLVLETTGEVLLDVGKNYSARTKLIPLAKGKGLEIGPGLNPCIKPKQDISVDYIESMSLSKWGEIYKLAPEQLDELRKQGLDKYYQLGDASNIDSLYNENSLDFIFTNHVFEHLVNPIRILEIWSSRLKSGGLAMGIIPDSRYCFDLRQTPSISQEWENEYERGGFEIEDCKLDRWIKNTSPSSDINSLKERSYSVHVHFYTPQTFTDLANIVIKRGLFSKIDVITNPNNKDFGFVLVKG